MTIEVVCPTKKEPVMAEIISNGTMEKTDWPVTEGLSGEQTRKWKTIIVRCSHCGQQHEYALTMNPR